MLMSAAKRGSEAVGQLILFVVVSVMAGLLVAGLALPLIGSLGLVARESSNTFQPTDLLTPPLQQSSRMLAADGSLIATFFEQDRADVALSKVAPLMREAIVAIEDQRFYEHGGIDLRGTLRALVVNHNTGTTQGGSSLTQQYVKNVLLQVAVANGDTAAINQATASDGVKGYTRKLRELQYAIALEDRLSKDQILERYLNIAFFGEQAYGIEAASRRYFSVHASQLTLPQAAYLAGLVRSPSGYDILRKPKNITDRRRLFEDAKGRRDTVIVTMAQLGLITPTQSLLARRVPLVAKPSRSPNGCANATQDAYFCTYVRELFLSDPTYGKTPEARENLLLHGGITIHTTIDPKMQAAAEQGIAKHIFPTDTAVGTVVILEPGTGKIKAMASSRPYGQDLAKHELSYNPAVDARYGGLAAAQPGSTYKAFTAVSALEQGYGFDYRINSPAQLKEVRAKDCDGGTQFHPKWSPNNESANEQGNFTMMQAMAKSVNTYWIQMEERTGICPPATLANEMGVHLATATAALPVPGNLLSFTIGTVDTTPLDMAKAYATFGARGITCQELAITGVTLRNGKQLEVPGSRCKRTMDTGVADAMNFLLRNVVRVGTGKPADIGRTQAGKTGTSEKNTAWFVGYTPELAAAVGVWDPRGPCNPKPPKGAPPCDHDLKSISLGGKFWDRVQGRQVPAPIWADVMKAALTGIPSHDFVFPQGRFFHGSKGGGATPKPTPTKTRPPSPTPTPTITAVPTPTANPTPTPKPKPPPKTTQPAPTPPPCIGKKCTPPPTPCPRKKCPSPGPTVNPAALIVASAPKPRS